MGKVKRDRLALKKGWISELGLQNIVELEGSQLNCKPCGKLYSFSQKGTLKLHCNSSTHKDNVLRYNAKPERQLLIRESIDRTNPFYSELCRAFVSAAIPWSKLENPRFHNFLEKFTHKNIPSESTLRKNYLPKIYGEALDELRSEVGNSFIWLQVDETTDASGKFIANVGVLRKDEPSKSHLLASKELVKTNSSTIVQLVLDAFQIFWTGSKQEEINDKFVLLLTDAVAYMLAAGNSLKCTYPDLLHVTCWDHGLHRVAEEIRSCYPLVDALVASVKKVFKKAPSRIDKFKEMFPDLNLPPEPVITRWGTWLSAVKYYAMNYENGKLVVSKFDPDDAAAIFKAQEVMSKPKLNQDLAHISANYTFMCKQMQELQAQGNSLDYSLKAVNDVEIKLLQVHGTTGSKIAKTFNAVLKRNPDLHVVKEINQILHGEEITGSSLKLAQSKVAAFKYAPMTTVDVERSFSQHRATYTDRRGRITPENLEMELVAHFEL